MSESKRKVSVLRDGKIVVSTDNGRIDADGGCYSVLDISEDYVISGADVERLLAFHSDVPFVRSYIRIDSTLGPCDKKCDAVLYMSRSDESRIIASQTGVLSSRVSELEDRASDEYGRHLESRSVLRRLVSEIEDYNARRPFFKGCFRPSAYLKRKLSERDLGKSLRSE